MNVRSGLGLAVFAAAGFVASPAGACGGFFCSQVPVDQAGENILFAVDGTNVTAHIQISYTGEAQKFSWVLPLPSMPTIGVGTDDLFTQLRQRTDPRLVLEWQNVAGCGAFDKCREQLFLDGGGGLDGADGEPSDGGVSVVAEGSVGAFEYKVVESSSGEALFTWLNDNGYDQPDASKPLVGYYVNQEFKFLALKLTKDKSAGDIQPVVVSYTSETFACVPLKLTSIAAAANMPVRAWVLAGARAVPMNYFHVTLNPKAYPWLECGSWWSGGSTDCAGAYEKLVTQAANAANGHAFVTEYAGPSAIMAKALYQQGQWNTDALKTISNPSDFLDALLQQGFPRNSLMQAVIRQWIPKPSELPQGCQEDSEFYTWNRDECFGYMPSDYVFDPAGMADDLQTRVVAPAKAAQALFGQHSYLTRVFTTVSPDEMTKDPIFSFNPDLPDVSNVHTTLATPVCEPGETQASKVTLTYPDGSEDTVSVKADECTAPLLDGAGGVVTPVSQIQSFGEEGPAKEVGSDDVDGAEAKLDLISPTPGQSTVKQDPAKAGKADTASGTFGPASSALAVDGADGADGAVGADGTDASDGTDGADAADGEAGSSGAGSSSGCGVTRPTPAAWLLGALALLTLLFLSRRRTAS